MRASPGASGSDSELLRAGLLLAALQNTVEQAVRRDLHQFCEQSHLPRDHRVGLMCVNRADSASCELIRLKDEGHRVGVLRRERGLDEPRAHSEDLDAVLYHFDAEAFAVVDNGSLAGAVGFRPRKAADAGNRTNADQRSGVSLDHRRKDVNAPG